ncbi:unnamed protein product [Lymnaea stagnalis]|uniref:Protein kinase domain-containing protein n=1 Tax=Lymnaea stagnalis TaxID=6523 RepID=A0AAV2H4X0_LYMST
MYLSSPQQLCLISATFFIVLSLCESVAADSFTPGSLVLTQVQSSSDKKLVTGTENEAEKAIISFNISSCVLKTGAGDNAFINLKPLSGLDGLTRYSATYNVSINKQEVTWNYTYNPCTPISLPTGNPHANNLFGDGCVSVTMCKYNMEGPEGPHYFALGVHNPDNIEVEQIKHGNETPIFTLVYSGIKSLRYFRSSIKLICDPKRQGADQGLFKIVLDNGLNLMISELHHKCCCVGACPHDGSELNQKGTNKKVGADGELMLVIVGTLVSLILMVALIGGLCYVKRTHLQFYSKLPGINPGGSPTNTTVPGAKISLLGKNSNGTKNSDLRDYEPAAISSARKKMIPVLADSSIQLESVEMGQRLGGGIFGDTHLAKWNEMTVTVKRLTVAIHDNQLTSETMKWMKEEVWFLSRQRHKHIVCVLGLCLNGRLPFLLTEYVIGECVKDFIKVNGKLLTWPQRIRLCSQVADGMAFLHSTKPPIIHRDLRCGNLFLSDNDLVKVADFDLTKLLQPMREQCSTDDCSCQRQLSACPATVRWTAPELLTHPRTKEGESSIISTACDVYSFGMVMWELVHCKDPFDEITTEYEVIEIVRNGGRPDIAPAYEMMPQFKDLMKSCWDQRPSIRPTFKHVAVRLKELIAQARSYQKHINSSKQRSQKMSETVVPV